MRTYPFMYIVGGFVFIDPIQESKMTRGYIHIETIPNIKIQPMNPIRNAMLTQVVTGSISKAIKSINLCCKCIFLNQRMRFFRSLIQTCTSIYNGKCKYFKELINKSTDNLMCVLNGFVLDWNNGLPNLTSSTSCPFRFLA